MLIPQTSYWLPHWSGSCLANFIMSKVFLRGPITDNILYNCSALPTWKVELSNSIKRPIWGTISIVYGTVSLILHILCILEIKLPKNFKFACYKLMFFNACGDVLATFLNTFFLGSFLLLGISFCDRPTHVFLTFSTAAGLWGACSFLCLTLALNRVLVISEVSQSVIDKLFSGSRVYIWISIAMCYGIYFFIFVEPPVYVNTYGILSFDPYIYEGRSHLYDNNVMIFNNSFIVVTTFTFYGNILTVLWRRKVSSLNERKQRSVFLQTVTVCGLNLYIAFSSIFFHHFEAVPKELGQSWVVAYQLSTGLPPFIFLLVNNSLRNGVKRRVYSVASSISKMN